MKTLELMDLGSFLLVTLLVCVLPVIVVSVGFEVLMQAWSGISIGSGRLAGSRVLYGSSENSYLSAANPVVPLSDKSRLVQSPTMREDPLIQLILQMPESSSLQCASGSKNEI